MSTTLSETQARRLRMHAQGLDDRGTDTTVAAVVRDCCGLQAQNAQQAPLSIRARGPELTATDVEAARVVDRSIVRTWCMRGSLHYLATADLPRELSLFGPLYVDRGQRRLTDLGLDVDDCERVMTIVRDTIVDEGPLTRGEVAERLLAEGFEFDPDGQAPVHIVRRACLEGISIEATSRDDEETYALLDGWVSLAPAPDREDALADLARRYVAAHEPATPEDFYSWSGLYKRDVRAGWEAIEEDLTDVEIEGDQAWTISDPSAIDAGESPTVRLLPMYDSYFLGHEDRDLVVPDEYADHVYPGGGVIRATVVVDGLAAGTWTFDRSRKTPVITVEPFEALDAGVEEGTEEEVSSIGRFYDLHVDLELET